MYTFSACACIFVTEKASAQSTLHAKTTGYQSFNANYFSRLVGWSLRGISTAKWNTVFGRFIHWSFFEHHVCGSSQIAIGRHSCYVHCFVSLCVAHLIFLFFVNFLFICLNSKYEEIYPPDVGEFVYITDHTYSKKQVLRMEQLILKVLTFDLCVPTTLSFTNLFCTMNSLPDKLRYLTTVSPKNACTRVDQSYQQLQKFMYFVIFSISVNCHCSMLIRICNFCHRKFRLQQWH